MSTATSEPRRTGWSALRSALSPHPTSARVVAAVLLGLLGFALAVQVRSTQQEGLDSLRQSDLVRILDDTAQRQARLRAEASQLEATREKLTSGTDSSRAAIEEARQRSQTLGILAGTLPAQGLGIVVTIPDQHQTVTSDLILDAVEELRDAGAEAIQVGDVRVVAQTSFTDAPGGTPGLLVDGSTVQPPYRIIAVGDAQTLATALRIPGGVADTLRGQGTQAEIETKDTVQVTALRPPTTPQYARPAPQPTK
ncbi:MAG: DUF881 domain-containing protein [Motilibacteraceae bacterium]